MVPHLPGVCCLRYSSASASLFPHTHPPPPAQAKEREVANTSHKQRTCKESIPRCFTGALHEIEHVANALGRNHLALPLPLPLPLPFQLPLPTCSRYLPRQGWLALIVYYLPTPPPLPNTNTNFPLPFVFIYSSPKSF